MLYFSVTLESVSDPYELFEPTLQTLKYGRCDIIGFSETSCVKRKKVRGALEGKKKGFIFKQKFPRGLLKSNVFFLLCFSHFYPARAEEVAQRDGHAYCV